MKSNTQNLNLVLRLFFISFSILHRKVVSKKGMQLILCSGQGIEHEGTPSEMCGNELIWINPQNTKHRRERKRRERREGEGERGEKE